MLYFLRSFKELQQKYDNLSSTVDQLVAIRNRRSLNAPGQGAEGRPRSSKSFYKSCVVKNFALGNSGQDLAKENG